MHRAPVELASCGSLDGLPPPRVPEVAFVGRSNVGKSSLINSILGQKLAPVSKTPGKTRTLRFYLWHPSSGETVGLVDLPGYGWAKVPGHVREGWHPLVEGYLTTRSTLRGVVLVADLRRGGTPLDAQMARWLSGRGLPYAVVSSKVDKVPRARRHALLAQLASCVGVDPGEIVPWSSLGEGHHAVRALVRQLVRGGRASAGTGKPRGDLGPRGAQGPRPAPPAQG